MPTLSSKHQKDPLKILNIGDSGAGKTGALASLVAAGYELFILDFDNGTDILGEVILNPALRTKVHIETLTDTGKLEGFGKAQKIIKLNPQAFTRALGLLNGWKDSETGQDFGPVAKWGQDRVLCVDSLGFMGMAALDYITARNGRMGEQPFQSDWGDAMRMLEQTLQILYSTEVKCHVVINSHIDYQQPEGGGLMKGLPLALGTKLSPKVGRYFNTILLTKSRGKDKIILTQPEGLVEVKCPILSAPRELPITSGLATLFKLWKEKGEALAKQEASSSKLETAMKIEAERKN